MNSLDDYKLMAPPIDDLVLTEVLVCACCGKDAKDGDVAASNCSSCGLDDPGFITIKEYR
jgi:hypothetical protein